MEQALPFFVAWVDEYVYMALAAPGMSTASDCISNVARTSSGFFAAAFRNSGPSLFVATVCHESLPSLSPRNVLLQTHEGL
jgi:hypothetical protein